MGQLCMQRERERKGKGERKGEKKTFYEDDFNE